METNHLSESEPINDPSSPVKADRKLGDEWQDWDGANLPVSYPPSSIPFVLFGLLTVLLVDGFGAAVFYMIEPRLGNWHPAAPHLAGALFLVAFLLFTIWFFGLITAITAGRNLLLMGRGRSYRFFLENFGPLVFWVGLRLGMNRDRLFNSFLYVNNRMVQRAIRIDDPGRVMILLPRCLDAATRQSLKELGERTGTKVAIAGGGDQAREYISKFRPKAIVAVACERDLVSGLRDVGAKIPVIALANERPEGPCKNTCVSPEAVAGAVARLTGRD